MRERAYSRDLNILTNDLGEFDAFSFPSYFEPCPTPSQPFNQLYR